MFKPIQWKTFPRDFLVIQTGFLFFGMAIALLIQANLGTNPWSMLSVALSDLSGLTVGTLIILIGIVVAAVAMALGESVGWGTLGNVLFIGPWADLFLWLIPFIEENWLLQGAMLLAGIVLLGLSTGLYISVNAGAGPRDSLMLALQRKTGWRIGRVRGAIELTVFAVGLLLGGPFGIGTVIIAVLIGPAIQRSFKLFGVERH